MKEALSLSFIFFGLQWQAGSRQQIVPSGYEPDKNNWGWNWLERWMAVRPWENRFLDINLKDGVMINENEAVEGKPGIKFVVKPSGRKPVSSLHSNSSNQKTALFPSDVSSSNRSVKMADASSLPSEKAKLKISAEEVLGESSSRPYGLVSRSNSTPKERNPQFDSQDRKRLSLPGNGTPQFLLMTVLLFQDTMKKMFFVLFHDAMKKMLVTFLCDLEITKF